MAAKIWNIGVLVGAVGIMAGDGAGFEWLNFPRYASLILFIAYVFIGIWAVLTFKVRQQDQLFPSQWYLLAALFWFAWIYSAANLLLVFSPVRGVVQLCVNAWYASNLLNVWLSVVGVGVIFYFIPKLISRPLHSYYLSLVAFWGIALFGGWSFINTNAPLPSWIPALSSVFTLMMILPIVCVALNVHGTLSGDFKSVRTNPILSFIVFGAFSFLIAQSMNVLSAFRPLNEKLFFTYFTAGQAHWLLQGFFASVAFGAIYYIAPRVIGVDLVQQKSIRRHLLVFVAGVIIYGLALTLGGIVQGANLNNASVPFDEVIKGTLPFLHASTIGSLLLVIAGLLFAVNLSSLCFNCVWGMGKQLVKKGEERP